METNELPRLCIKNCGFFGNAMYGNMCSKCFKETHPDNQNSLLSNPTDPSEAAAAVVQALSTQQQQQLPSSSPHHSPQSQPTASTQDDAATTVSVQQSSHLQFVEPSASGTAQTTSPVLSQAALGGIHSSTVAPSSPINSSTTPANLDTANPGTGESSGGEKADADGTTASSAISSAPSTPAQERKDRCLTCRSKISLAKQISNKCRCGYIYCDAHRTPTIHDCKFDHMALQQEVLEKRNVKLHDKKTGGRSFTRID